MCIRDSDLKDLREKRDELKEAKEKDKSRSRRRGRSRKRRKSDKVRGLSPGGKKKMKVSSSSSSPEIQTDVTMPRAASSKGLQALFAGTGLDIREKTRRRVARRAKRLVRRKKQDRGERAVPEFHVRPRPGDRLRPGGGFLRGSHEDPTGGGQLHWCCRARSLADMRRVLLQTAGFEEQAHW